MRAGAHPGIAGLWSKAVGFCSNRRGVAAVEFALIVPILLVMYFMTMEASQAIETSKKVSRIGSMVADLVTQQPTIVKADLDAIMKIGTSTIQPYNRSTPNITITAIQVTMTPPAAGRGRASGGTLYRRAAKDTHHDAPQRSGSLHFHPRRKQPPTARTSIC